MTPEFKYRAYSPGDKFWIPAYRVNSSGYVVEVSVVPQVRCLNNPNGFGENYGAYEPVWGEWQDIKVED